MSDLWLAETLLGGAFFGAALLALTKRFQPEVTGFISRWHAFFWRICLPRVLFPLAFLLVLSHCGFFRH